jgi:hypothetical protein
MESYGMRVAEARAFGLYILARDAGTSTNLVAAPIGEVFAHDVPPRRVPARIAADAALAERLRRALPAPPPPPSWRETAASSSRGFPRLSGARRETRCPRRTARRHEAPGRVERVEGCGAHAAAYRRAERRSNNPRRAGRTRSGASSRDLALADETIRRQPRGAEPQQRRDRAVPEPVAVGVRHTKRPPGFNARATLRSTAALSTMCSKAPTQNATSKVPSVTPGSSFGVAGPEPLPLPSNPFHGTVAPRSRSCDHERSVPSAPAKSPASGSRWFPGPQPISQHMVRRPELREGAYRREAIREELFSGAVRSW